MANDVRFAITTDPARGFVTVRYCGRVTAADMAACADEVERRVADLKAGFTTLTDLTDLEAMELDCVSHLARIMDVCRARGVSTVVRVIPDPDKDIGFNILSIIHYRKGVKIITCETMAEAERVLGP